MTGRAAVFDLDGTLADSLADIAAAANHVLRGLGQPEHPLDAYRHFVGEGVGRLLENALPPTRQDLHPEAVAAFRAYYPAHLLDRTRPYPGVPELLEALAEREVPLGVLSNKPHEATRTMVAALFGEAAFACVEGDRAGRPRKPDPAGALEVARALGVAPAQVLYVGDTRIDVATARAAGMTAVGVLWGFRDLAELREAGAHHIIARPAELLDLL